MRETEKILTNRPDLALFWAAREERLQRGNFCDKCNSDFDGRSMRTEAYTSPPEEDFPPKLEVRLVCNPSCDGSDGFVVYE